MIINVDNGKAICVARELSHTAKARREKKKKIEEKCARHGYICIYASSRGILFHADAIPLNLTIYFLVAFIKFTFIFLEKQTRGFCVKARRIPIFLIHFNTLYIRMTFYCVGKQMSHKNRSDYLAHRQPSYNADIFYRNAVLYETRAHIPPKKRQGLDSILLQQFVNRVSKPR